MGQPDGSSVFRERGHRPGVLRQETLTHGRGCWRNVNVAKQKLTPFPHLLLFYELNPTILRAAFVAVVGSDRRRRPIADSP